MSHVRRKSGQIVVTLTPEERQVVSTLLTAVRALLTPDDEEANAPDIDPLATLVGMSDSPVETPEDPVLRRLLPDAYADPEHSAEFRRLTDSELRTRKTDALDRVLADVGSDAPIVLDPDEGAGLWLQALNDVRLVIGTRLDVTDEWVETFEALPPDDPRIPLFLFYDWLSVLQESLVRAALKG